MYTGHEIQNISKVDTKKFQKHWMCFLQEEAVKQSSKEDWDSLRAGSHSKHR